MLGLEFLGVLKFGIENLGPVQMSEAAWGPVLEAAGSSGGLGGTVEYRAVERRQP